MQGIEITTNILTKKLVVASSLLGLDGGTSRSREKVELTELMLLEEEEAKKQ